MEIYRGSQFLSHVFPKLPYVVGNGVLPASNRAVLFGPPKSGKSLLMNQVCVAVIHGKDWMGFPTKPNKILYCNFEVTPIAWQERLRKYCAAVKCHITDDLTPACDLMGIKLDTSFGQAEMERSIIQHQPRLLVLDPLFKVLSESSSSDESVLACFYFLDRMIQTYQLSVWIVAHSRKTLVTKSGAVEMGSQELRGSYQIPGWVDSIMSLTPVDKGGDVCQLWFQCRNADRELKPLNLRLNRNIAGFEIIP